MMEILAGLLLALAPGDDHPEVDLASALARRGWVDLADELCSRLGKLPGASIARAEAASAHARMAPSPEAAAKEIDRGIAELGSPKTPDEWGMAGSLRVQKAKLLGESLEAPGAWRDAEAFYETSAEALKAMAGGKDVEEALLDARLELPKALAAHARITKDEAPRKALLGRAVYLLGEFQFDTGTQPITFEALLEEGRARVDLKDYARAERCLRSVLALSPKGPAGDSYVSALRDAAFLNLLRLQTLSGRWKEAVAAADDYLKTPGRAGTILGRAVRLSKAEALWAGSDRIAAIALAQAIATADPTGVYGTAARDRLAEWTRDGGVTAEQLLLIADGLIDRGLYREALVDLRRCVEVCKAPAGLAKYEPIASFKRGECFRALKREAEASLAFQDVFRKYPKHELAERAAFEAVRAKIRSAAATHDRREEEQQQALLEEIRGKGVQGAFADYFTFLEAEIVERKGQWKAAADLYRKVGEGCEVYDDALVSAGHCLRRDAESRRDPQGLAAAEALLRRADARLEKSSQVRLRASALVELASLLLHESVNRPKEALDCVIRCATLLPAETELSPRLGELEIRARLGSGDVTGASERLDRLLAAPSGGTAVLRSARRVAAALEASDPAKAARTYRVWLERSIGEDVGPGEVTTVADALYGLARQVSGFDAKTVSVVDLRGKPVPQRGIWGDAADAQGRVLALPGLAAPERTSALVRRVTCEGLAAFSAAEWGRVKNHAEEILLLYDFVGPNGINGAALQKSGWLAGVYMDYGYALHQLGKAGQKFQYENALTVFKNLQDVTERASSPWWASRAMQARILFDRGEAGDLRLLGALISTLSVRYPDFDEGKFGVKPLLVELQGQLRALEGGKR